MNEQEEENEQEKITPTTITPTTITTTITTTTIEPAPISPTPTQALHQKIFHRRTERLNELYRNQAGMSQGERSQTPPMSPYPISAAGTQTNIAPTPSNAYPGPLMWKWITWVQGGLPTPDPFLL